MTQGTRTVLLILAVLGGLTCLFAGGLAVLLGDSAPSVAAEDPAEPADPTLEVGPDGPRQRWKGVSFIVPVGLSATVSDDGVALKRPEAEGQGSCMAVVLAKRPADGLPDAQALAVLLAYFQGKYRGLQDPQGGRRWSSFQRRGDSGRGWTFVELHRMRLTDPSGKATDAAARILLARAGDQVVPIIGYEAGDRRCLDDVGEGHQAWALLLHSLELDGAAAPADALASKLVGAWHAGGSGGLVREEFDADGTYRSGAGARREHDVSPTTVEVTDTTVVGEGTWTLRGNRLTIAPGGRAPPKTTLIRLYSEPNSAVASGWLESLASLRRGPDGFPYELVLRRE